MLAYFRFSPGDPFVGDLWLADADGTDARRLARGDLQTLSAEWSPDGTRIAYAEWGGIDQGRGTYVVDVTTGETSKVLDDAYFAEWVDGHTWIIGPPAR
jgi:Tol biopolymer transport system component